MEVSKVIAGSCPVKSNSVLSSAARLDPPVSHVEVLDLHALWVCIMFLYGLMFGSFANGVGYRLPRGESILVHRSRCTSCDNTLAIADRVPIVSWLALRRRCRICHAPISWRYPVIELTTGLLWAFTWAEIHPLALCVAWLAFWLYIMTTVCTDLTSMTVPDILTLPAAIAFVGVACLTHDVRWWAAILGAVIGFGTIFAIHLLSGGNMGLGDAKLYLAIGAMLGPRRTLVSFILAAICGSVVGLGLRWIGRIQEKQPIPFVPFIAIGVIISAFWGSSLVHRYAVMMHV